jgi:hypothetical protein
MKKGLKAPFLVADLLAFWPLVRWVQQGAVTNFHYRRFVLLTKVLNENGVTLNGFVRG